MRLNAMVEGELQMGFIGLPQLAVGLNAGLRFSLDYLEDTRRGWTLGMTGPTSVDELVSNAFLRFYL